MPMIQINCRPTGGLADHRDFISDGISSSLETDIFSDLTFICGNHSLSSHQSMIGPLSPMLAGFFEQLNCCNCRGSYCDKKEVIQVHIADTSWETMDSVLSVIYTGRAAYSSLAQVDAVRECLNLLDIKIDLEVGGAAPSEMVIGEEGLGFKVEQSEVMNGAKGLGFRVSSVVSYSKSVSDVSNRSTTFGSPKGRKGSGVSNGSLISGVKRKMTSSASPVDAKRMKPEPSRSVETQMVMLQELRKLDIGVSIGCKMPGCGQPITLNQMTKHFQQHMMQEASGQLVDSEQKKEEAVGETEVRSPVTFPCSQCGKQFKFRKALDAHVKNNHQVVVPLPESSREPSIKDIISDSESEPDLTVEDFANHQVVATLPKTSMEPSIRDIISDSDSEPELTVEDFANEKNDTGAEVEEIMELKCETCNKMLRSEWHRPPFRHDCNSIKKIVQELETDRSLVCELCNQTVESLWYKPPLRHFCPKVPSSEFPRRVEPTVEAIKPTVPSMVTIETQGKQLLYQEKCNICNRVFANEKSLKTHKNMAHNPKNSVPEVASACIKEELPAIDTFLAKTKDKFYCQLCSKGFPEFKAMKTHYTFDHFWSDLTKQYGKWDVTCQICEKSYPTRSHLLQHMGNFHGSITIDKYLDAGKFQILTRENSVKLLSFTCEICAMVKGCSADLKAHLSTKHFSRQLVTEFSSGEAKCKKCPKCGKQFDRSGSASTIAAHLGSFHDEVLKYALPYIKMDDNDRAQIATDDFEDGVEVVENAETQSESKCEHCKEQMKDRLQLKIHYQQYHYSQHFKKMYPTTECNNCAPVMKFDKDLTLHRHIAINHEFVLQTLLKKDGLSLPPQPEKKKMQATPKKKTESYTCLLCSNILDSKDGLKIHYYREHFNQYFDNIYINKQCCFCGKFFIDIDKAQKHIALKHEHVLNNLLAKEKHEFCLPWKEEVGLKKKKNHKGSVFDYLASELQDVPLPCQKCPNQFKTVTSLKMHYITHYWDHLKSSSGCKFCSDPCDVSDMQGFREHLVDKHERVLLELMAQEGLFTGKCKEFEIGEGIQLKDLNIQLKNLHVVIEDVNYDLHGNSAEGNHKCPIVGCSVSSDLRSTFLTHLMDDHFWANLQQDFRVSYMNDNECCPICKKKNEDGMEKTYLKHIAVDHEQVMKYVQAHVAKQSTTEILAKIHPKPLNHENGIVENDEDPDDPSYIPSVDGEEEATVEAIKTKSQIILKDIKSLLKPSIPTKPQPAAESTKDISAKPQPASESSKATKPQPASESSKDGCKCRNCGRMFDTPYKMQTHQRNCKWTCTKCNQAFNLQSEFSGHIGTCAGPKKQTNVESSKVERYKWPCP